MTRSGVLKVVGLVVIVLLVAAAYRLLGPVIVPKAEQRLGEIGLTANEIAANGPLSGDVSLYPKELACAEKRPTPGYYQSVNGAELTDSERSGLFNCATFTGSYDGPNQVFAWRSADGYQAASYINNRKPGELYISGGDMPPGKGPVPAGPFVAKVDATRGKEIWRTYLDNGNVSARGSPTPISTSCRTARSSPPGRTRSCCSTATRASS